MKKALIIFAVLITGLLLCKGWLFRLMVSYSAIGERPQISITDATLLTEIDRINPTTDLPTLVAAAEDITTYSLNFTFDAAPRDPNQLIHSKAANCVGYSAMFNSVLNLLLKRNHLDDQYQVKHRIGRLYLFGINLHQFFDSPFFRDHDFNEVRDLNSGEVMAIDPSVSDYLRISRVSERE